MENFVTNPIIIVDDDADDLELTIHAIRELGYDNEIITYNSGDQLISGLIEGQKTPFIIICDINLPQKNGLEVRKMLTDENQLKFMTIPFVFWSTAATDHQINEAFDLWSQGVFEKPATVDDLRNMLGVILDYWKLCGHPKKRTSGRGN